MRFLSALLLSLLFFSFVNAQSTTAIEASTPPPVKEVKVEKDAPNEDMSIVRPIAKENGKVVLPSEKKSAMRIPKISAAPVIDGNLDDAIWRDAAIFRDFIQTGPGDNIEPSKATIVYMAYDEKHLYLAFRCFDEKDKIRATIAKRDGVFGEDNVRVWLDTYDDQRRAYVLGFNPLGIQQDGIFTEGQGADFNVDILMESKGAIHEWGWAVEVKIPFKSLRYSAGKGKNWGFNAARNIDRMNDEFDTWMPDDRNIPGFLVKHGKITGLDEIKTERTLEIIPTMTFKETGKRVSPTKFSNPPVEPDFGFTLKYSLTPNVTLDAAYNPDFADTEADAPVVEANQRFPIFFAEKRPFFLEGIDTFNTRIQAVYTRRIENPDVALKLTGKVGKTSFGMFGAVDDPLNNPFEKKAYAGVFRVKRDIGKESNIGFLATSYTYPQKHNQVAGFDGKWKIDKNSEFIGQVLFSNSKNCFFDPAFNPSEAATQAARNSELCGDSRSEYRTGNAISYDTRYLMAKKNLAYGFGARGASKYYRADLGFTQRTDTSQYYTFLELNTDPKPKEFIISKNFNTSFGIRHDWTGRIQGWGTDINFNLQLKGNSFTSFGGYFGGEWLREDEFGPKRSATQTGQFFGEPQRQANQGGMFFFMNKRFNKRFYVEGNASFDINQFDFDFGAGPRFPRVSPAALAGSGRQDPGTGKQFNINFFTEFKPTDKLSTGFSFNKARLVRDDTGLVSFDSNIFSSRTTYQFSRAVFLRARIDYNTLSSRIFGQYTFGWTPSPGKAFYVGYNDNWNYNGFFQGNRYSGFRQLNRTFFIKFSYLFRKSF